MTKGESFKSFLRYINQATVSGEPTDPEQYADYKDKHANFLDGAQRFLAKFRPIKRTMTVNVDDPAVTMSCGYYLIALSVTVEKVRSVETARGSIGWRLSGDSAVQLLGGFSWPVNIYYNKKPDRIDIDADDSTPLELDDDVAGLEPLLNAVWSTKQDDPSLSDDLQNLFDRTAGPILNDAPVHGNRVVTRYSLMG